MMCYDVLMSDQDHPAKVGVRELRQNLSVYLDRVKAGALEVTEHGHRSHAHSAPEPRPSSTG
jgi:hypothetical protein